MLFFYVTNNFCYCTNQWEIKKSSRTHTEITMLPVTMRRVEFTRVDCVFFLWIKLEHIQTCYCVTSGHVMEVCHQLSLQCFSLNSRQTSSSLATYGNQWHSHNTVHGDEALNISAVYNRHDQCNSGQESL